MKNLLIYPFLCFTLTCVNAQESETTFQECIANTIYSKTGVSREVWEYYTGNQHSGGSKSVGTVSDGKLVNGYIFPPTGKNFKYFDEDSYLEGRAFTNEKVLNTILLAYHYLDSLYPGRKFQTMELSNKDGGKMFPHRTHQNGMSCDFMMPKIKDGAPYYSLDSIGKEHYFLSFSEDGKYSEDASISVEFDLIAHHILLLNEAAKQYGLKIKKVIIKTEYKPFLFATEYGQQLKKSNIYVVQKLTPLINALHDDHYHIDFEPL